MQRLRLAIAGALVLAAFTPSCARAQVSPERLRLANAVLDAMDFDRTYLASVSGLVPAGTKSASANDAEGPDPVIAFYRKYAPVSDVRPQIARAYATRFTEPELRSLVTFYSSPTGKKAAGMHADLESELQGIVLRAGARHQAELVDAIAKSSKRARGGSTVKAAKNPTPR